MLMKKTSHNLLIIFNIIKDVCLTIILPQQKQLR